MNLANHKTFALFTLKLKRFREWQADLRAEKPGLSEFYLMGKLMVRIFFYPRPLAVKRAVYFRRLWICHHCPIFDKSLKRCRKGEDGCGCYMPFKALAPVDGWIREQALAKAKSQMEIAKVLAETSCWGLAEYNGEKKSN